MVTCSRLSTGATGAAPARGCVARAASCSQAVWQRRAAAVGVASVLSIQIINRNALGAFAGSMRAISGDAEFSILGWTPTFSEALYPRSTKRTKQTRFVSSSTAIMPKTHPLLARYREGLHVRLRCIRSLRCFAIHQFANHKMQRLLSAHCALFIYPLSTE